MTHNTKLDIESLNFLIRSKMKSITILPFLVFVFFQLHAAPLVEFNQILPKHGVVWNSKTPSFYTGFAMRVEAPHRLHFRMARGNVLRLTAILDDLAVMTYPYQLLKRATVYKDIQNQGLIQKKYIDTLSQYQSIVSGDYYGIQAMTSQFERGKLTKAQLYQKSLNLLAALNPGRVFPMKFSFQNLLENWKAPLSQFLAQYKLSETSSKDSLLRIFSKNPKDTLWLIEQFLPGRINSTHTSKHTQLALAQLITSLGTDQSLTQAKNFFIKATGVKYQFQTAIGGTWKNALTCTNNDCFLEYYEFTAVYPVGTAASYTKDRDGNSIGKIRTLGARYFVDNQDQGHDVDNIRSKSYYGWAPKMDYQTNGNGIHNPAVLLRLRSEKNFDLYKELKIDKDYKYLWSPARGGVSRGCIRMGLGHLWEVRHIFPTSNQYLKAVRYFGNDSRDYDVFDINGDGQLEVMGSPYFIAYSLMGDDDDSRYQGKELTKESFNRLPFYKKLYGLGQYYIEGNKLIFKKAFQSFFQSSRPNNKAKPFSKRSAKNIPLYEQDYEKEKVQFYRLRDIKEKNILKPKKNTRNPIKQFIRVLGRINGCGPFHNNPSCQEKAFDNEYYQLIQEVKRKQK